MLSRFNLIIIILLVVWISFFPPPVQEKYQLATKGFLMLAFSALLVKKRNSIFKRGDYFLWFFIIMIGLNVLFAQKKGVAFRTYLDLVIPIFFIYYLIWDIFSFDTRFELLAITITISSSLVALGGISEMLFGINPLYKHFIENPFYERHIRGFVQSMSTQFHPVALGSYLIASLPFSFYLFKKSKSILKLLGSIGIVLNIVVMIFTFSQGAFLGLMAMIGFYLFVQKKYRLLIIFFICFSTLLLICCFLPNPFNKFGMHRIIGKKGGILSPYRLNRCITTLRIIREHPFVGVGFQHFRIRFYEYYPGKQEIPYERMIADNMYLTILAETGIIGFLGFSIFIFSLLKKAWRQLNTLNYFSQKRWQLLISLMAFIGLLVGLVGYEFFYWPNPYLYFCILIGCISAFCIG